MKNIKQFLPPVFWQISIVFNLIATGCYLFFGDKAILFFINQYHNNYLDVLHVVFSFFGRGEVIGIVLLLLLLIPTFRTLSHFIWSVIYGTFTIIITRYLKKIFLIDRPLLQYPGNQLHIVSWVEQAYIYSFPSGHTLGIFSLFSFVILSCNITNTSIQISMAMLAICCGISRIYLAQHFMSDVLFGEILGIFIGTTIGTAAYRLIKPIQK
jgi:membrane-associated phospholipid phosphatase